MKTQCCACIRYLLLAETSQAKSKLDLSLFSTLLVWRSHICITSLTALRFFD
ncbi:hypothetical protein N7519_003643 [Penicillium mononematosum]|uniref:uncharacterized protein n=1 Tax=Penicillium mononematosum TaxID=268346 RepID=UPI002546702C|nr:uncharacterized protein N7519_003643 [Penicillium mononematosum]KAJ6188735.1 hypothetical protein N7519_003643 [Penicillium mononematosum]